MPDSERLLRTHSAWIAEWDGSSLRAEAPDIEEITKQAFNLYASGLLPVQVRWRLGELHSGVAPRLLANAQRRAERLLIAAESAPAELRRAQVAVARQAAIQGALAAGEWGQALKGLDRAGEIAGELREAAGLADEDLVLTISIEGDQPAIPGAETAETGETAGESQVETE